MLPDSELTAGSSIQTRILHTPRAYTRFLYLVWWLVIKEDDANFKHFASVNINKTWHVCSSSREKKKQY